MNASAMNSLDALSGLSSVTVTYNPDLDVLKRQLETIPPGCMKVIVDNGSMNQNELQEFIGGNASIKLLLSPDNLGLAEALNRGVAHAATFAGIEYVLLLDQDSAPARGAVERLFSAMRNLEQKAGLCAAGPRMMDAVTGLHHGFHVITRWRWQRVYPSVESVPVECSNINGSGILTSIKAWKKCGGMDAGLFIDHVDTDWSFRMLSKNMPLFGISGADFSHCMGVGSRRIWLFGWHVIPIRSRLRHYYLFRNTVRLMRRDYVPTVWKAWAVVKMLMTLLMVGLAGPGRLKQLSSIMRGLRDV